MAKDYRKKKSARSSGAFRQFVLVFISFVCGYLSSTLFDVGHLGVWLKTHVQALQNKPNHPTVAVVQQAQLPKPKFEFYTLLTNERSSVPSVKLSNNGNPNPDMATSSKSASVNSTTAALASKEKAVSLLGTNVNKDSFLIQVASFKNKQEAERIKASLTLKGFNVNVSFVNQQGINWYRVVVGPFNSRILAEKAQLEVARSERITGMIRKMNA